MPGASLYTDGGGGSLAGNTSPVFYILPGPASLRDAAYFLGAAQRELKRRMQGLDLKEVTCGGRIYYDLGDSRTAASRNASFWRDSTRFC